MLNRLVMVRPHGNHPSSNAILSTERLARPIAPAASAERQNLIVRKAAGRARAAPIGGKYEWRARTTRGPSRSAARVQYCCPGPARRYAREAHAGFASQEANRPAPSNLERNSSDSHRAAWVSDCKGAPRSLATVARDRSIRALAWCVRVVGNISQNVSRSRSMCARTCAAE